MFKRIALIGAAIICAQFSPAQTTTPNLGLALPAYASPNWNVYVNGNSQKIDAAIGRMQLPYQGGWSSTAVYQRGDQVDYLGIVYASAVNSNFGNIPGSSAAWQTLPSFTSDAIARAAAASAQATANAALPANGCTTSTGGNLNCGTVAAGKSIQNVVQASGYANVAAALAANPSATTINMDTVGQSAYTDTTLNIPAGVTLKADFGASFANGATITWNSPYTFTEQGVIYPFFPLGDVRRYGVFPGNTDWTNAYPARMAAIFNNCSTAKLPVPVFWPSGYYATSLNFSSAYSGCRMVFAPGVVGPDGVYNGAYVGGIVHLISNSGSSAVINQCTVTNLSRDSSNNVTATLTGTCALVNGQQVYVWRTYSDSSFQGGPFTLTSVSGSPKVTSATWNQGNTCGATKSSACPSVASFSTFGQVSDPPLQGVYIENLATTDRIGTINFTNSRLVNMRNLSDPNHHVQYPGSPGRGVHLDSGTYNDSFEGTVYVDGAGAGTGVALNTDAAFSADGNLYHDSFDTIIVKDSETYGAIFRGDGLHVKHLRIDNFCRVGWANNSLQHALVYLGAWNNATTYTQYQTVLQGGVYYAATSASGNLNITPPNATYWTVVTGQMQGRNNLASSTQCAGLETTQVWNSDFEDVQVSRSTDSAAASFDAKLGETGDSTAAGSFFGGVTFGSLILKNCIALGCVEFGDTLSQPLTMNYKIGRASFSAQTSTALTSGSYLANEYAVAGVGISTMRTANADIGSLELDPQSNFGFYQAAGTYLHLGSVGTTLGATGNYLNLNGSFDIGPVAESIALSSTAPTVTANGSGTIAGITQLYPNTAANPALSISSNTGPISVGYLNSPDAASSGVVNFNSASNVNLSNVNVNCGTGSGYGLYFAGTLSNITINGGTIQNCTYNVLKSGTPTFTNVLLKNVRFATPKTGNSNIPANTSGFRFIESPGADASGTNTSLGSTTINGATPPAISGTPTTGNCTSFGSGGTLIDSGAPCAGSTATASTLRFGFQYAAIATPAAGSTYHLGADAGFMAPTTTVPYWPVVVPKSCVIRSVKYYAFVQGNHDTGANNVTLSLYNITTSTSYADTQATVAFNGSANPSVGLLSGLTTDSVTTGDNLEVRAAMPATWGTQPTNVNFGAVVYCY